MVLPRLAAEGWQPAVLSGAVEASAVGSELSGELGGAAAVGEWLAGRDERELAAVGGAAFGVYVAAFGLAMASHRPEQELYVSGAGDRGRL